MIADQRLTEISKKRMATTVAIILLIFLVGMTLRLETTNLYGITDNEKAFYEDQNGLPYMYDMDSYYNYRMTQDYLDHGYLGDTIINNTQWDLHSYYPPGRSAEYPPLIAYLAVLFYKLVNIFTNTPLIVVCFWLPAIIGPISGIIAYFFTRKYTNEYGAIAAGIFTVTSPLLLSRTIPGWFDTDMFNVLFPLLITWLFFEAINNKNNFQKGLISIIAAFSMFLFSIAWEGWVYTFYIIMIFSFLYILWCIFKRIQVKKFAYVFGIFFSGTLLMILIFSGLSALINLFTSPIEFMNISGSHVPLSSWPNIYISVSELQIPSPEEVISGVGLAFFGGLFGFLWILRILLNKNLKKQILNNMTWFLYTFLVIWALISFFLILEGGRYIMMLIPPMVISAGIMIGICIEYLHILKDNEMFKRRKDLIKILSTMLLVLLISLSIINVYASFSSLIPGANDDLWAASQWISDNNSNNTVIISDWSYGHLFTAITNHYVSIDGGSQNSPRTYWIDKAFETDNESLSLGIFKMIATTGDLGYLTLNNYTENVTITAGILNNILGLNKKEALTVMTKNYNLSTQEAQNVLKYTHPDKPRHFILVTTNDMVNKGYWIFYFGTWNFNKMKGNDLTYTFGNIDINNNILNSSNGISMNLNTGNVTWNGQTPYSAIIVKDGDIKKYYPNKNSTFDVIINIDSNKSVLIDKWFENSLFTKLVIEKSNSTIFKPIYKDNTVTVWES